jgi:hypothetical protein
MGLVDSIIGVESGGNPNATNPRSSASGLGQFIDSTWLATIRQAKPELAGKSDAELLALKTDPQLSREMTDVYANQNQAILSKAGVPVTPGTTYLAHFAGPGGAVKVLQADPGAMAGDVLGPAVVKANPFLAKMTVGDLQAWADRKMGGSSPQPKPAQAAPAAPASGLLAQAPQTPAGLAPPQAGGLLQAPSSGGMLAPMPVEQPMSAPPIQFVQRRPIDLSGLRATLAQRASSLSRG